MTTVLVTGASGYLGAHVLEALGRQGGLSIHATGLPPAPAGAVPFHALDLGDTAATADLLVRLAPDVVLHMAAAVPRNDAAYGDDTAAEASVALTASVVTALRSTMPHARLVFTSSMTVYGDASPAPGFPDQVAPQSAYARGKHRAEQLVEGSGLTSRSVRLPGLFGAPRRGGLVFEVLCAAAERRQPRVPAKPLNWSAIHTPDAAAALAHLVGSAFTGTRTLDVGYDEPISVNRLLEAVGLGAATDVQHPEFQLDAEGLRAEAIPIPPGGIAAALQRAAQGFGLAVPALEGFQP